MKKELITALMALSLAACGGGGGEDDTGGTIPEPGNSLIPENFVSGTFHSVPAEASNGLISDELIRSNLTYYGCETSTRYFKTDDGRVRVYGTNAYSDYDFQAMATVINAQIDPVLASLDLTRSEFENARPAFVPDYLPTILISMTDEENLNPPSSSEGAALKVWNEWSNGQRLNYVASLPAEYGNLPPMHLNATIGCLSSEVTLTSGQTTVGYDPLFYGMNLPPEYQQWPAHIFEIATRDLTRFVATNLSQGISVNPTLPHWFFEGQSIYMADQAIAAPSEHYNYEPVSDVVSPLGELDGNVDYGLAQEHYALAYRYLRDHNSQADINAMMMLARGFVGFNGPERIVLSYTDSGAPDEFGHTIAFDRAFDLTMVDHLGSSLTLERFQSEYHDLINNAYPTQSTN